MAADATTTSTDEEADALLRERLGEDPPIEAGPVSDNDDIDLNVEHRSWTFQGTYDVFIGGTTETQQFERTYIQKPLSYSAMMEFTGLLGTKIDQAMKTGLSVDQIMMSASGEGFSLPVALQDGQLMVNSDGPGGIDGVLSFVVKLMSILPDIILDAQCIWLRVPRQERAILADIWSRSPDDGGLSMDQGEEMMALFIAQNYGELERFFVERLRRLANTAIAARRRSQQDRA